MKDVIYKTFDSEIKQEKKSRRMTFTISTGAVDRDGDIVEPKGWETDAFMTNPCVLFAHDYKSLPVAKAVSLTKTEKSLIAVAEFPEKGTYPFADTVYDMLKGGFLNATSVGFKPLEYEPIEKGFRITRQSLLEFSIVPVPANQEALVMARDVSNGEEFRTPLIEWSEKFLASTKGAGQWVVGADLDGTNIAKHVLDELPMLLRKFGFKENANSDEHPGYPGCTRSGGCPTNRDGSPENCTMADCPMKAQGGVGDGPKSHEDEEDILAGIIAPAYPEDIQCSFEDVDRILRQIVTESASGPIREAVREQLNYACGRVD